MFRTFRVSVVLVSIGSSFLLLPGSAEAATFTVGPGKQYADIQSAIGAASAGDRIIVVAGTYGGFTVGKQVTIEAEVFDRNNPQNNNTEITGEIEVRGNWAWDQGPVLRGVALTAGVDKPYSIFGPAAGTIEYSYVTAGSDGVSFEGGGGIVRGNYIERTGDDCIDVDHQTKDVLVEDNRLVNCGQDGIEIRQHDDSILSRITYTMRNNRVEGTGEDGLQIMDYNNFSNRLYRVERNLFLNSGTAAIGLQNDRNTNASFDAAPMPEPLYAVNNTFVSNGGAISGGANLIAVNNIFEGNNLDLKNVGGSSKVLYSLFATSPQLSGSNNLDSPTTFVGDPQLNSDFIPQSGSPVIDAGLATYQHSYDYDGSLGGNAQTHNDTVVNLSAGEYSGTGPDFGWMETGAAGSSPTLEPTVGLEPSATPQPTNTQIPTATLQPSATAAPASCPADGDYNGDGAVNLSDFDAWRADYFSGQATLSCFEYWRRAAFQLS